MLKMISGAEDAFHAVGRTVEALDSFKGQIQFAPLERSLCYLPLKQAFLTATTYVHIAVGFARKAFFHANAQSRAKCLEVSAFTAYCQNHFLLKTLEDKRIL